MSRASRLTGVARLVTTLAVVATTASAQARVVNIVPLRQSGETAANPEPSLAVDRKDPRFMSVATFVSYDDACERGAWSPMYTSRSGGERWSMVCALRRDTAGIAPGDVVLQYGIGSRLFAAMLQPSDELDLHVYAIRDPLHIEPGDLVMQRQRVDQPWTTVARMAGREFLLVSGNDKKLVTDPTAPSTGAVFVSESLSVHDPTFRRQLPDARSIVGQNYATRLASRGDSVVYAVFYSPQGDSMDVVVARDDSAGLAAFRAVRDSVATAGPRCSGRDGNPGFRVARCRLVPFVNRNDPAFGQERRVAANLSIAVDPRDNRMVYVAWADSVDANHYTLHVRASHDGGASWSADLDTVINATNPALAIDTLGTVGFAYQQLEISGGDTSWVTRIKLTDDAFRTSRMFVLARVPAMTPRAQFVPYIGDYIQLLAVGATFYGVFSANNTPDSTHFPNGVAFQRRADFGRRVLLDAAGVQPVPISIDPFFFRLGKAEHPECATLRATAISPPARAAVAPDAVRTRTRARTRMREIGCRP